MQFNTLLRYSSVKASESSSSPASFSPPIRYFDRLPLEIIQHIFHSLLLPHSFKGCYQERQRVLRLVCLVSRLFRRLAQPLLFGTVEITGKGGIQAMETLGSRSRGADLLRSARVLVVKRGGSIGQKKIVGQHLLSHTPLIEEIRCSSPYLTLELSLCTSTLKLLGTEHH